MRAQCQPASCATAMYSVAAACCDGCTLSSSQICSYYLEHPHWQPNCNVALRTSDTSFCCAAAPPSVLAVLPSSALHRIGRSRRRILRVRLVCWLRRVLLVPQLHGGHVLAWRLRRNVHILWRSVCVLHLLLWRRSGRVAIQGYLMVLLQTGDAARNRAEAAAEEGQAHERDDQGCDPALRLQVAGHPAASLWDPFVRHNDLARERRCARRSYRYAWERKYALHRVKRAKLRC